MLIRSLLYIAAILIATFALYSPSWSSEFVLDDMTKLQENPDLRTPFQLRNFVYPYAEKVMHFRNDPSRPLTFMLYWVCWQASEGSPKPFHILNTAVHAGAAVLLMFLTLQLSQLLYHERSWAAALMAAGLFLSSPLIAGTVAYPFGLSDLLCAFFSLAMLVLLIEKQTVSRSRMIVAVGFYLLALLSKQAGFVAPALLIALDYFTGKGNTPWRKLHIYTPLLSMSAIYLCVRYLYFGGIGDLEGVNETLPWTTYASVEGAMIFKYLLHTFVPTGLTIDHQPFPDDVPLWWRTLAWLMLAVFSGFAMTARWSRLKAVKLVGLAWIFFLICLLPTSSILPTVDLFVERRAYFADLAVFAAAGILLWRISLNWKWWVWLGSALAVSAQAAVSVARQETYANPEKLWKESLALYPKNTRAMVNLGVYYSKVERWEESRKVLEELLALRPDNGAVYTKLAYIYHQKNYAGRNDEMAWRLYQKGLELMPDNIFALYNVGVFLTEQNRSAEAIAYFNRVTALSPQFTRAWVAAGQAALIAGDKPQAKTYFEKALVIDPSLQEPKAFLKELDRR